MPAADVLEQIRALAEGVARSYGLELFDVQFRREHGGWVVRVRVDRPGPASTAEESVSIGDCERVSRDLSAVLDVEDAISMAYTLEVSSPGLDRPLRHAADYERFAGRLAKVVLSESIDGQKYFKGRLKGIEGAAGSVVIEDAGGRVHHLPMALIARGNLEVEF